MNQTQFDEFVYAAVKRIDVQTGRIGHLGCTQVFVRSNGTREAKVREPELRVALLLEAENSQRLYGIEVPTIEEYGFTGKGDMKGRLDFVLFESIPAAQDKRDVLVELKAQLAHIANDFEKICREPRTTGRCIIHLCHGFDSGTKKNILSKYSANANAAVKKFGPVPCDWFFLYIVVCQPRSAGQKPFLLRHEWDGHNWVNELCRPI